jgi:hypothetical protein
MGLIEQFRLLFCGPIRMGQVERVVIADRTTSMI